MTPRVRYRPATEWQVISAAPDGRNRTVATFAGLSHLSLSVSDRDRSLSWYTEVLGFSVGVARMDEVDWKRSICTHPSGIMLSLTEHLVSRPFDFTNAGVDHVSFTVIDRTELESWQRVFAERSVVHSPIDETDTALVLSFKDPDNIPLEFFLFKD
jgi:glyoxylase I family protein